MGLLPSKQSIAIWFAVRFYRDGIKGKKGVRTMEFLKKLSGFRTAIMALVLLAEVVSKSLGYEAGPIFSLVNGLFAGIGWDPSSVKSVIGIDIAALGAAIATIFFAVKRFVAWRGEQAALPK